MYSLSKHFGRPEVFLAFVSMAGSMLSNTGLTSKYYILSIVQSGCLVNLSPGANDYHLPYARHFNPRLVYFLRTF